MNYYKIAVSAPLMEPLVYQSKDPIELGSFVQVPLGKRTVQGLLLANSRRPKFTVKDIIKKEDAALLSTHRIKWLSWISKYYCYPIGLTASLCYLKKPKIKKSPVIDEKKISRKSIALTENQKKCVLDIQKFLKFKVHLLYGVTGSGKTQVYLKLIEDKIKKNQGVLVLVPEIGLTSQLFQRISQVFPGDAAVIHSGLSLRQKKIEWESVVSGRKKILLGARSALFCPIHDLSLIILDEEHETHFKQEDKLRYHGRDSALRLAQIYDIPIVLGSATPSLESWARADANQYMLHKMKNRFHNQSLPKFHIIDLKKETKNLERPFWLSEFLYKSIKDTLTQKKQSALFLNRRGQTSLSLCGVCGNNFNCPHCDISLTLHSDQYLVCHYCNYFIGEEQAACPSCGKKEWLHLGIGTQTVYSDIKRLFPQARVRLADSDHIHSSTEFKDLVQDMEKGCVDILIGTQMIAKGLDFPNLDLMGIVMADAALYGQDFRAIERSYQMITQVGGRSGRHSGAGHVVVQTYNPDHYIFSMAATGGFEKMAARELYHRKKLKYPPYTRLALIRVSSTTKALAHKEAKKIEKQCKKLFEDHKVQCLGPAPAVVFKLKSKYRYHLLLKSRNSKWIQELCESILAFKTSGKVQVQINKDPVFF